MDLGSWNGGGGSALDHGRTHAEGAILSPLRRSAALLLLATAGSWSTGQAQIQIRVGDPHRALYSELHEALQEGSPAADSVARLLRSTSAAKLWRLGQASLRGSANLNSGLIAFTRLAELRSKAYSDSAAKVERRLAAAPFPPFPANPGLTAEDVLPSLHAILLERRRLVSGDSTVLADILGRISKKDYDHGDAWVLGRLGAGALDSVVTRFRKADSEEFRVRYLTLLSYFTDPRVIPLLARVYVAPDSFGVPKRYAVRASDGLLWIGTRESLQALLDARAEARKEGVYADSSLTRGGYDFLANDSSSVISRTGQWLTGWIGTLPAGSSP